MTAPEIIIPVLGNYQPWFCSALAATLVGVAGILPIIFIPVGYEVLKKDDSFNVLHLLLSFAVGGLLADVFVHLLPEAWSIAISGGYTPQQAFNVVGLCVLCGIFIFVVVEMLAKEGDSHLCVQDQLYKEWEPQYTSVTNKYLDQKDRKFVNKSNHNENFRNNNAAKWNRAEFQIQPNVKKTKVTGYLNLIANGVDNFSHGLAVAGSFLVSYKCGVLTTTAILIHEIPHEIGDFAILLKSGFSRWEAAKAQLVTASIGLIGAILTILAGSSHCLDGIQVYILGFTAGGFLNIALVEVLPELMNETRPAQSAAQLFFLLSGTAIMSTIAVVA